MSNGTVLIVDDDPGIRRTFTRVLKGAGYQVLSAPTADAALAEIGNIRGLDTILTDLQMPGMDGVEFLRRARRMDEDIPLIVVTGNPSIESAIAAIEQGGFRYLLKPVTADALLEAVRSATAMCRLARLKRRAIDLLGKEAEGVDRVKLSAQFDQAMTELWVAFQPIVDFANGTVFGYEALVRSKSGVFKDPGALFDAAERLGRVHEIGRSVRRMVASASADAPPHVLFFVNVHPADLADQELLAKDSPLSHHAQRTVLEITERSSLAGVDDLKTKIQGLRDLGYRIALDDLGSGYAGFVSFNMIEPEVVKLDMALIRDVDRSSRKQSLIQSMLSVCEAELGTPVVCEGIETEAERDALIRLGGNLFQGYLFAKPAAELRVPERFRLPAASDAMGSSGVHAIRPRVESAKGAASGSSDG